MIRLIVIDDHPAIAAAIDAVVRGRPELGIQLVAAPTTTSEGLAAVEREHPDVVVCDLWIEGAPSGLEVLATLTRSVPGVAPARVLVLSGLDQPSFLRAAFEGGAAGYLSKASPVETIVDTIATVARGGTSFPAMTLRALREAPRRPSERELGAIRLVARGASNDEIAAGLGISIKTVESHLRRLFGRYGVLSRTELAMLAVREGWLGTDP
ncbi:MAG TPA: response regulator transcription factor [Candidatus Limnocylindrales bacterium]|nr:response regulator transcription factor [Candidatus Limnocylindrales bacterium]